MDHAIVPRFRVARRGVACVTVLASLVLVGALVAQEPPPEHREWFAQDIGLTGSTGSSAGTPPAVTMNAGGTDIYGTADGFRFAGVAIDIPLRLITRVDSMTRSDAWAKAGLVIRTSLEPDAVNAGIFVTPNNVIVFQARTAAGGTTTSVHGGYYSTPVWLKLHRADGYVSGWVSTDGENWRLVASQTINVGVFRPAYVGIAGCSHNPSAQTAISFSSISYESLSLPYSTEPPLDLRATVDEAGRVYLSWIDNSDNDMGFVIQARPEDNSGPIVELGETGGTTFVISGGLAAGKAYEISVYAAGQRRGTESGPVYTRVVMPTVSVEPPGAPTNLGISGRTSNSISLGWQGSGSVTEHFELERALDGGAFSLLTELDGALTEYTDTALSSTVSYSYRVRAVNAAGASAYSATVTGSPFGEPPADWSGRDIGSTGSTGSSAGAPPTVTLNGGGADIWGAADSFYYYSRKVTGDVTVRARVASFANTDAWAKVGVMIRTSLNPDAPNAALLLTPRQLALFQSRAIAAGATTDVQRAGTVTPHWVKVERVGNRFSGYVSADGNVWTLVGTRDIAMPSEVYVGLVACSHNRSAQTVASFDGVSVATTSAPPPPPPVAWHGQSWRTERDATFRVETSADTVTIAGRSPDLWGTSDGGIFVYQTFLGDAVMVTRVDSVTPADPYSKAGLMYRGSLDMYGPNVSLVVTAERGLILQWRSSAGFTTSAVRQVANVRAPVHLRLARTGNQFLAAYSTDGGTTWISLGTVNLTLPASAYLGPVATSHTTTVQSTATFSQIR